MENFHLEGMKIFLITVSTSMLLCSLCHADENFLRGSSCSGDDNSTLNNPFQTNLNSLLNSLSTNVNLHNGFYKATSGNGSNMLCGLIQCRGDLSSNDCSNCTKESINEALRECSQSKMVTMWFRWCFLRYSNEKFFGKLGEFSVGNSNDTDFEDSAVISKGIAFMGGLASSAPNEPLMFQTSVLDGGLRGKRYGMAQCTRDISRSDCGKCLDGLLVSLGTTVGDKRGWEIFGFTCMMWYHDFQFYSNFSTPASAGTRIVWNGGALIGTTLAIVVDLVIL